MDHTSLTSKFDLPPPKKKIPFIYRCFIHPPPKWVPIEWPQLPTLQACGKPSKAAWTGLFDKLRELELGVCHPRFRNGNRVEKTGAHFTNPKKKKKKASKSFSFCICIVWLDPSFDDPWKMRGGKSSTGSWKKQGVFLSPKFHAIFFVESMASSIWKVWTFVKGTQFLPNREYGRKGIKRRICVKYNKKAAPNSSIYIHCMYQYIYI